MIYDPFERDLAPTFVTLTVRQAGEARCDLLLAVEGRGTRTRRLLEGGSNVLAYEITRDGRVLENEFDTPQMRVSFTVPAGGQSRIEQRFRVSGGEFVRAGEYTDQLVLRLYEVGSGTPRRVGTETVLPTSALVPARAYANIAGSDSNTFGSNPAGSIDFGELRTGVEREAFLQIRATSPVLVRLASAQQGQLRHATFGRSVLGVPYSLTVAGEQVALATGPVQFARTGSARLAPERYPLRFRNVDAASRIAGLYQDVLTITVEPR